MANIARPKYDASIYGLVPASNFLQSDLDIIPNGQVWEINKIIFSDQGIGDNKSGEFLVEFGTSIIARGFVSGSIIEINVDKSYMGDGIKRFRITRTNNSSLEKNMLVSIEGIKRL